MIKPKSVFFVLFVLLFAGQVFAQNNWDRYKPRSLREITANLAEASFKNPDVLITNKEKAFSIILSADTFPSKVRAIYTGTSRKVSEKKKEIIALWLGTYGKPKEYLDMFEDEYLFTEDSVEYWLPAQKQVAAFFDKELKKGEQVILYVAWIGARKEAKSVEHVILMNEFEKEE